MTARVLNRNNLVHALKQVQRNKGAPGVDGMTVDDLPALFKRHWQMIRQQLIDGVYSPKPVLRVEIPKPDGRKRKLGIPTVLDRLIQQAIYHNAHQAIGYAQAVVRQGYDWVIDCDLEAFFDNVNHDLLMTQLRTRHKDMVLLRLIKRFLKAGVCINGIK